MGLAGGYADILLKKRLLTLFLDTRKSGKFQSLSRMQQQLMPIVDTYIPTNFGARASFVGHIPYSA